MKQENNRDRMSIYSSKFYSNVGSEMLVEHENYSRKSTFTLDYCENQVP